MPQKLYGALDLGSNTFRLILARARADGRGPEPGSKRVWQEIPRISEGLAPGGTFGEIPLARAWKALEGFSGTVRRFRPQRVVAGATMAMRLSSGGRAFLSEANRRFGWDCELLDGTEEARLSALGALNSLDPPPERSVVFDIGGRSTEFIALKGSRVESLKSLPVGVVGLTEDFVRGDPPAPGELEVLEAKVREVLRDAPAAPGGEGQGPPELIGTAGTVTTLAAMLLGLKTYSPEKIQGAKVSRGPIEALYRELASEPVSRRASRPGLHPLRADVITGGLALVLGVLDRYASDFLTASDDGLLEGLWMASAGIASLKTQP
jgi:exopolyphosphatase/guanosine-5'-triphosphate,3'-diphosphate pyrophosphatase